MRHTQTGKVIEDFYVIGSATVPVYLMDGPVPALFDAGLTALALDYEADIRKILGNRTPGYLFLTHSHFDHVGAAAHLKSLYPAMKIAGSNRTGEILHKDKAVRLMRMLNRESAISMKSLTEGALYLGPFEPFELDVKLEGGERISLGPSSHVEVIHTPGHTWDFMSYWIPEHKILIASEAVGCDEGAGDIITEFLVDYDIYIRSLTGLRQLDVQVLCQGHRIVFTGLDALAHMERSLDQASRYVAMVEAFLGEEKGDIERTVARVKAVEWDPRPWPKQPESAYVLNTRTRVTTVKRRLEGG